MVAIYATSTLMMTSETGIFLLFSSVLFLITLLYILYIFWPTSHTDFDMSVEDYSKRDKRYRY